ncbi:PREDICTED: general vesicular transport factor p115 isoform X1 [Trachymyrmex cornetzi]|uniref:general vesicular transport factor p115 isoform X1 n=1 Tax=Trachymyrmex cornetzi TaxID=471704 RepID=UPI00084F2857|nr:PREDICTED: general vesicular transport factor p115 isoform X1 [Trachymyrmex cornetzi]XP_018361249.1 PREDICTED: general vesicular transport factor p115 isoform X1 [Trachymyrmex cornetzi]
MEYFKSSLKSVLGTAPTGTQSTGADTVERLVDRLQSSSLLDDRRDACRALKAMSRTFRVEVGAQGMDALRQVLEMDRTDCEIIGLALDTLCNITNPEMFDEEVDKHGPKNKIGEQFTEIFIKHSDSIGLVLAFLEEFDFRVRWPALKLLTHLLANRSKDIQEIILVSPMGVSKLMDLLSDSREVIRNDVLLLLIQLTKGNANIQKIVAFENAFDRIFDVIDQEGNADGGIVVEDCLLLMLNLLRGNVSNQNFFKEGSYIQKLTPMFQIPNEMEDNNLGGWSPQKVSNVHCMVQVVRALVAPSAPAQAVAACQRTMRACGLLQALCDILMASGVPADVLTETINTVAEVIRGNASNQEFLAGVMAPSTPPRPAIVVLLMSMVNEKQPFVLRCSVLYCFQCFLYKNEVGQTQLVQTLLPQGNEAPSLTTGQLLCGGLFSIDSLSNWFSAVALSHALIENISQKEQLLRVLLATNIGKPPVTLMQQCVMLLQQGNKTQCKLGLLILLCRWTSYCPLAVKSFLAIDSSVAYLTALLSSQENNDDLQETLLQSMCALLIGICVHFNDDSVPTYTKEKVCNLIENRIGWEKFQDAIGGIARHEIYSRTLKHPQPSAKNPSELLLDHEFCRLLKSLEGVIIKSVIDANNENKNQLSVMNLPDNTLISQYKDLIREQDIQIQRLNQANDFLTKEKQEFEAQVQELRSTVSHLRDQNLVLRAAQANIGDGKETSASSNNLDLEKELQTYKTMVADLENRLAEYTHIMQQHNEKDKENKESYLKSQLKLKIDELEKLKKDQEALLELLTDQDSKITLYKERLIELGDKVESDESSGELDTDDQPESTDYI